MINRTFKWENNTTPIIIGYMAVITTTDPTTNSLTIWHQSHVVTEEDDAKYIIKQWGTQDFGYDHHYFTFSIMPVYGTTPIPMHNLLSTGLPIGSGKR